MSSISVSLYFNVKFREKPEICSKQKKKKKVLEENIDDYLQSQSLKVENKDGRIYLFVKLKTFP